MNTEQIRPLDLQDKIVDIIQKSFAEYIGSNEAELDAAHYIEQLVLDYGKQQWDAGYAKGYKAGMEGNEIIIDSINNI